MSEKAIRQFASCIVFASAFVFSHPAWSDGTFALSKSSLPDQWNGYTPLGLADINGDGLADIVHTATSGYVKASLAEQ